MRKSKLYDSGAGPLQYRSRPGRYGICQGKGKFGKLGGGKSCSVVYGSAQSLGCMVHAKASFLVRCLLDVMYSFILLSVNHNSSLHALKKSLPDELTFFPKIMNPLY